MSDVFDLHTQSVLSTSYARHTHTPNKNLRHEQTKLNKAWPIDELKLHYILCKVAGTLQLYWWNRGEWPPNDSTTIGELNITSSPLHHQEPSVFISANKFLGNPPDDFHSNLDTRWLLSSTAQGKSTRRKKQEFFSFLPPARLAFCI